MSDSSSPSEDGEPLLDVLTGNTIKSAFEKTPHEFIPHGTIDREVTRASILEAMDVDEPSKEDEMLVTFILESAKKVFAIAVYIELKSLYKAISLFEKSGFVDTKLPIRANTNPYPKSAKGPQHPFAAMEEPVKRDKDRIWTSGKLKMFQEYQWRFLAPVFSITESNHDLGENIVPFISKQLSFGEGSFGVVSKYEIHKDHIQDPENKGPKFYAVKEIKPASQEDRQEVARHWAAEVKALAKMNTLKQKHIVRFITAFRRGKPDDPEHYLMTEWADGGNLRDLWKANPKPKLTASLVKAAVKQLFGLAEALCAAHYLDDGRASYRHGDLKPANILWFRDDANGMGTLKIGDWGEAKSHNVVTELRPNKTTAKYGTRRYEAPEVVTGLRLTYLGQAVQRRSRLYDIWAMGCITLEFIVWLLYGVDELDRFNRSVREELNDNSPFYQITDVNRKKAIVHSAAVQWMDHMAKDPACRVGTTALGDLLEIVRRGLLVVKLPKRMGTSRIMTSTQPLVRRTGTYLGTEKDENISDVPASQTTITPPGAAVANVPSFEITPAVPDRIPVQPEPEAEGPARFLATDFRDRLEHIVNEDEEESYWYTNQLRRPAPASFKGLASASIESETEYHTEDTVGNASSKNETGSDGLIAPDREKLDYAHPELDPDDWDFQVDNAFATNLFTNLKPTNTAHVPEACASSRLCGQCSSFRDQLWQPGFSITYEVERLEASNKKRDCDLCGLLWRTCERNWGVMFPTVQFDRVGSLLKMNGGGRPVLSIFRNSKTEIPGQNDIQIGFGDLPEAGNFTHMEVIRQWLNDCDSNHAVSTCQPNTGEPSSNADAPARLPTRLIDVGHADDDEVRLWETGSKDTGDWVALSHQWGPSPPMVHFFTTRQNLKDHIAGMKLEKLPATFKDAVRVTRALGRRYLWIDSICIVQGKDGDFQQEAGRMGQVYSGAYCVIAASRANGHSSGFLQARNRRDYIPLCSGSEQEASFYIGQTIDNFQGHVLEGALNRRGWVLQEHALARRTIFFTEHQTYWECGHGVRCETMTKMNNNSAALLGDPNFPHILNKAPHGERILRYQALYRIYSRLGLSKAYDRPTAIDSLQTRLLDTMEVQGGFGVFDEVETKGLLCRSLLWHRGSDTPGLIRITFPSDRTIVPSWSWMSYTGGIDYLELDFGGYEWEDIQTPWSREEKREGDITLTAKARKYDRSAAAPGEDDLIFDSPAEPDQVTTLCVVLGIQRGKIPLKDKRHYVLIVVPTQDLMSDGARLYERVGAGYLPGKCIAQDTVVTNIR